jgi:hypothetical protein
VGRPPGAAHTDLRVYSYTGVIERGNSISFQKDAVKVALTQQKFNKQQYRFSYYKDAPTQIEYDVIWRIEKGLYKDRYVAYGF